MRTPATRPCVEQATNRRSDDRTDRDMAPTGPHALTQRGSDSAAPSHVLPGHSGWLARRRNRVLVTR
jgi:hypothetical protein